MKNSIPPLVASVETSDILLNVTREEHDKILKLQKTYLSCKKPGYWTDHHYEKLIFFIYDLQTERMEEGRYSHNTGYEPIENPTQIERSGF